jgi:hypothetical protein
MAQIMFTPREHFIQSHERILGRLRSVIQHLILHATCLDSLFGFAFSLFSAAIHIGLEIFLEF